MIPSKPLIWPESSVASGANLSVYLPTKPASGAHSACAILVYDLRASTGPGRRVAKATELVMCFGGGTLA